MLVRRCFLWCLFYLASLASFSQEICDNGKDEDNDGMADLRDPECQCRYTITKNLLQNGSFEKSTHCPTYIYDNDYSIMQHWRYGTYTAGNEAHYYHNLHCSLDSSIVMTYIPPALPLPDGYSFVSIRQALYRRPGYTEKDVSKTYISQCLRAPLEAGEEYSFSFNAGRFRSNDDSAFRYRNEPFTVAIFGHADCNAVPFGSRTVNSNGCPTNFLGWILLGKRTLQSDGRWVQHRFNFTAPPDINVVAIGPDCAILNPDTPLVDSTTFADFYVYYLDDVNLLPIKELLLPAVQTISGNRCVGDSLLKAPALPGATYQWYRDSLAIPGANGQSYGVPPGGEGFYNVRVTTTDTCFVTEAFYYGRSGLSRIRLPQDTVFCKGEPLMLAPAVEGISYRWDSRAGDAVSVNKEGIYKITASDLNGCTRNFTVTVREQDCNAPVYLPDAFTPNGDGRNDVFRIPPGSTIRLLEFSIYNRWGERVFTTKNKSTGWTGLNGSKRCEAGTYVYVLRVQKNNQPTTVSGTVTLIR